MGAVDGSPAACWCLADQLLPDCAAASAPLASSWVALHPHRHDQPSLGDQRTPCCSLLSSRRMRPALALSPSGSNTR